MELLIGALRCAEGGFPKDFRLDLSCKFDFCSKAPFSREDSLFGQQDQPLDSTRYCQRSSPATMMPFAILVTALAATLVATLVAGQEVTPAIAPRASSALWMRCPLPPAPAGWTPPFFANGHRQNDVLCSLLLDPGRDLRRRPGRNFGDQSLPGLALLPAVWDPTTARSR